MTEIKQCHAKTPKEWRAWLQKNHDKETKVQLIKFKKHTGKPALSHQESMDEAICFGWIDTTVKRIDDERFMRNFAKRNKNSRWSNATLSYAKRLIKEKRMTPAGLKMYKEGLEKPVIDHGFPRNPETPPNLLKELKKTNLEQQFKDLSPSSKRVYIYELLKAVRPETKQKRIREIIKQMIINEKSGLYPRKRRK